MRIDLFSGNKAIYGDSVYYFLYGWEHVHYYSPYRKISPSIQRGKNYTLLCKLGQSNLKGLPNFDKSGKTITMGLSFPVTVITVEVLPSRNKVLVVTQPHLSLNVSTEPDTVSFGIPCKLGIVGVYATHERGTFTILDNHVSLLVKDFHLLGTAMLAISGKVY
jgi:hypothetical protein